MMQQLLDFGDAVRGEITRVERTLDSRALTLEVLVRRSDRSQAQPERWRVEARDVRQFKLVFPEEVDAIRLAEQHPLLWTHRQDELELTFHGALADPFGTIGRLHARHEALAHGWIPFATFLNTAVPLHELLSSPAGMLARGPRTLIAAYRDVLETSGARCSVLDHGHFEDADDGPQLLLLGKSFIVAASFDAARVQCPASGPSVGAGTGL